MVTHHYRTVPLTLKVRRLLQVRRRRWLPTVAALAMGTSGCGDSTSATEGRPAERMYPAVRDLPEKVSPHGVISVGNPNAPTTIRIYEDPAVGASRALVSKDLQPDLRDLMLEGEVRTEYVLFSFVDVETGGSAKAINALRAAFTHQQFAEYHEHVFKHYPEHLEDGYTDTYLIQLAGKIPALQKDNFKEAVVNMRYWQFMNIAHQTYTGAGEPGVPTIEIDGETLSSGDHLAILGEGKLRAYLDTRQ
ncbi:DsbA family protein [Streptomyces xantholiticus]